MTAKIPENTQCCWKNCEKIGAYPAPRSSDHLHEYQWFCLEHIRAFNASWNFFDGMSDTQAEAFQLSSIYGHRPTWKRGCLSYYDIQQLLESVLSGTFFTLTQYVQHASAPKQLLQLTHEQAHALATLQLETLDKDQIKKTYRKLVKQFHPDVNKDNPEAEAMFKKISSSYQILMQLWK